ncbi:hypothetical protein NP493_37g09007 [Ridgeia piscesae]|uniref:Uncharacterized protein n=1 Tax=Ridgeia piscesae TaxID=27915 RepID=A0AAD9PCN5_RIDPI|nr:hypothetical protein NP493_37g09007 [Ridgeia piscesae]
MPPLRHVLAPHFGGASTNIVAPHSHTATYDAFTPIRVVLPVSTIRGLSFVSSLLVQPLSQHCLLTQSLMGDATIFTPTAVCTFNTLLHTRPLSRAGRYQGDPWAAYMMSTTFSFVSVSVTSLTVKMRTLSSSVSSRLASWVRSLSYLDFSYEPSEFFGFLMNSSAVIPVKQQTCWMTDSQSTQ